MGRNFSQRPSQLLLIEDEKLAFDFDRCANARLQIYDVEKEKRAIEAMAGGAIGNVLGGRSEGQQPIVLNQ